MSCPAPIPDPRMGDDGTGHCRECGCDIGTFDFRCRTCLDALEVIAGNKIVVEVRSA